MNKERIAITCLSLAYPICFALSVALRRFMLRVTCSRAALFGYWQWAMGYGLWATSVKRILPSADGSFKALQFVTVSFT